MSSRTKVGLALGDFFLVMLSLVGAVALRLDFDHGAMARFLDPVAWFYPSVAATVVFVFWLLGIYHKVWRYAGVSDLLSIVAGVTIAFVPFQVAVVFTGGAVFPRTSLIVGWFIAVAGCGGIRFLLRLASERQGTGIGKRVLIVGAGDAGEAVLRDLRRSAGRVQVVGLVDDQPGHRGLRIHGVAVLGSVDDLSELVEALAVSQVILAQPAPALVRRVVDGLAGSQVELRVAPGLTELAEANLLREVRIEDLLERDPIRLDMEGVASYLAGRTVLVTGAGGSIGSEICRQVSKFSPKLLILLGRGENSIYEISLELREHKIACYIADVRDPSRMRSLFELYKPEVVFHAAAHKHVPLMEANPSEAVSNNVFGTLQVMELSREHGVEKFILLSTDKAVNPCSVMGATKRMCELLLVSQRSPGFVAVRFGNVLGSRGSVIPTFRRQILRGGPVTVTDPEMSRYFMTIPEAVTLVLQAAAISRGGELYILDMGQPVKIVDLARNLIRLSGFEPDRDIPIEFTGIRPGEKLREGLINEGEQTAPSGAPKIMKVTTAPPGPDWPGSQLEELRQAAERDDGERCVELIQQLLGNFKTGVEVPVELNVGQTLEQAKESPAQQGIHAHSEP
ncbi:polysaccharide biosynthesis protein [bacterium CPR1]|nr:polysaccharide biosynthesis protein [bacterium CPR1]